MWERIFKKMKKLYRQAVFLFKKEGLGKVMLRVFNYVFFGKGVLNRKEIKIWRDKLKVGTFDVRLVKTLNVNTLEKIEFLGNENPKVSIIIPVFNNWKYTYNCLQSLNKNIQGISYEIIVVDDGSTDETEIVLGKVGNIVYIKNEKNLGFVGSCNVGAKVAKGEYLVFLNNDTSIKKKWLEALLETFQNNKNIGLVGSKLIYPDGKLQEAGGIVWKNENAWNYGRFQNPNDPEFNYLKDVDYCSGASIMIPKNVFEKLNGFDPIFSPGYFEDTDLAFRVRQLRLRSVYQPKSELFHFEGISSGNSLKSGMKKYQEINKDKFFARWWDILEKENMNDDTDGPFLARDKSKGRKVVLFMDNGVPTFDRDAGSFIAFQYIKILNSLNYKVIFWPHNLEKIEPYTETLQQMGIETIYGCENFSKFVKKNGKFIDFAFLSRPHVAEEYMDIVRQNSDAKILYIPHDLHFLREMRSAQVSGSAMMEKEVNGTKKLEESAIKKADNSLFFSDKEVEIVKNEFPGVLAEVTPWIQEIENYNPARFEDRKGLIFIGGYNHKPNVDAVKWFHREIFPKILEKIPDAEVTFYGSHTPKEIMDLSADNFKIAGFVAEKDVKGVFNSAKIFIAPLRFGAGFKGKIAKAMSNGLPVVTTDIGAEGIGLTDGENTLIANDVESYVENIEKLYKNEEVWRKISKNSIEHIQRNFSIENAKQRIIEIFEKI